MSKSIRNTTMLGSLSISVWEARKTDKSTARKAETDANATPGTVTAAKHLLAGVKELQTVKDYATASRMWWAKVSLPWFDSGPRAYAAVKHLDLITEIGDRQRQFTEYVDDFLRCYPAARAHREFEMGALFDASQFPHIEVVRSKFRFSFDFSPVPNTEDLRIVEGLVDPDELVKELRGREAARVTEAMREATRKLYSVVKKMHDTMSIKIGDPGAKFNDSKLENILELVEIMPGLNLVDDPELIKLTKEAKKLATRSPDELRKDEHKREAAAREAKALATKLKGMFGGLED